LKLKINYYLDKHSGSPEWIIAVNYTYFKKSKKKRL